MKCLEVFGNNELIQILNREEKDSLLANCICVNYKKGAKLVRSGEFISNSYFVVSGYVKLHLSFLRKNLIIDIYGPNRFIALPQMLNLSQHPFDITALDETIVCQVDIEVFRKIAQTNNEFILNILSLFNKSVIGYVNNNLFSLTQNNIRGRLANTLVYLSESVYKANSFDLLLSRKELSEYCCISRENVIKILYEFDHEKIISLSGKTIKINSMEGLKRISVLG